MTIALSLEKQLFSTQRRRLPERPWSQQVISPEKQKWPGEYSKINAYRNRLARGTQSSVDPTLLGNRAWPLGFDQGLQTDCGLRLVAWVHPLHLCSREKPVEGMNSCLRKKQICLCPQHLAFNFLGFSWGSIDPRIRTHAMHRAS